jgi:uncharacterized protein involved in high-affinity Fe2+ transport
MRKKTALIAALAALGVLAVSAAPILADEMPPGMPDLEAALKAKAVASQPDQAHAQGKQHSSHQMHSQMMQGQMMQGHQMAMRSSHDRDNESSGMSGGGC